MTLPRLSRFAVALAGGIAGALIMSGAAVSAPEARPAPAKPEKADGKAKTPLDLTARRVAVDVDPATAIQKANAWFNAAPTMVGDFVQIGPDGRRSEGKIYVQRPGRLRFEYAQPATMEIIADGTSVVIRDRKLATQDTYFLSQTPLKFLLKDNIDLQKDVRIESVTGDGATSTIAVEDKATFGGTSHIKLMFDSKTFSLKQWQVTDPQGYETLVSLYNIDLTTKPDPSLFRISTERFVTPN